MKGFACALVLLALAVPASLARADGRYFVGTYLSHVDSAGHRELELWSTAFPGQGDSTNTDWENRAEIEYAVTNRLTGSIYLNYAQSGAPEAPQRFEGPSLELIYALAEPGRIPLDPAAYLEVRENGDELELEPKLLLSGRMDRWVGAANVIGEFEWHHRNVEGEPETRKSLAFAAGLSREVGGWLAVGLEGRYLRESPETGEDPAALFVGPTINFQADEIGIAVGWQPQLWGSPQSTSSLNLADFPRSEVRMILSVDL